MFRRDGLSPETVLPRYEQIKARALEEPAATLRAAAIWERLSLGLNVIFMLWVHAIEAGRPSTVARDLARLLSVGIRSSELAGVDDLSDQEGALATAVVSLRQAVRRRDDLAHRGVDLPGVEWFDLAREIVRSHRPPRARARDAIERLLQKHLEAKGDDAWVHGYGSALELARDPGAGWTVPGRVRLHGYRMAAFDSVARDLGGI